MYSPYSISPSNRKIDPTRRSGTRPDGSPADNDRVEIGPTPMAFELWQSQGLAMPDLTAIREYRLQRLRQQLRERDIAGLLMWDPLNIRYATDTTNMQLWISHNPCRACFVPAEGPVILWDFHGCEILSRHLPLVDEVRGSHAFFYFEGGDRCDEFAGNLAAELDDLLRRHGGGNRRLAVDRMELPGVRACERLGIELLDGGEVCEHARKIKSAQEIAAMRCSIASCEAGMRAMEGALQAGMTENDLWAILHAENIRHGGEWIETRLLASGPRTNPWFQECGPRLIQDGDIVAFDTDLIGVYGICVDISRTWLCGDGPASAEQRELYRVALDHIRCNTEILRPGMSFREMTEQGKRLPEKYRAQQYGVMYHGVGLCDEYPAIRYLEALEGHGYDGVLKPGMCICVEAYVGAVGGREGVKLEEQVLITDSGYEVLSQYPFDERLMA